MGLVGAILAVLVIGALAVFAVWRFTTTAVNPGVRGIPIRNARPDEPLTITRYLPSGPGLAGSPVPVKRETDTQAQAQEALLSIMAGDQKSPVLASMKLRGFFLDQSGTAYVDVTGGGQEAIRASAGDELLAVYAVVNTLMQNFEEIRQVRFLMEGREAETLAGHIDLARSFTKRMDLIVQ